MTISISAYTPNFVAEIYDADLSKPVPAADMSAIKQAFWKYGVLVFPEQKLSPQNHVDFAQQFGPIEMDRVLAMENAAPRLGSAFADISNLNGQGEIWDKNSRQRMYKEGNKLWHTDSSFKYRPGLCSLLYSTTVVPIGGHTEFADQRAAYDALPGDMKKKLAGLIAEHSIEASRRRTGFANFEPEEARRLPPVPQLLVRTIPENGRKSLYVASHIGRIKGMGAEESEALLQQLLAHITQRQFVHIHRWRPNDLVMWDNRCTMHRGTDFDDMRFVRDMRRATVSDVAYTCEQEGVAVPA
ncbi:MAG TPA: TauD/TfdA family dioxygenase [Burkholderiales bacterium]|nr:TauD/TfdA family dioxygenase [Burkholderiales bacterium]